jgi:hypothetical protein
MAVLNGGVESDPYRLNRDVLASSRLSLQHYIWKETMGYILHPSIDTSNENIRIADIGTGTGYVRRQIFTYTVVG